VTGRSHGELDRARRKATRFAVAATDRSALGFDEISQSINQLINHLFAL